MRKTPIITLLVLAGLAVPWVAAAQDCQYQSFKVDLSTATLIDPISNYDVCMEASKVVGTINGTYRVCFYYSDFVPSSDIFLYGLDEVQTAHFSALLTTKKGTIEAEGFGWIDGDSGLESGFAKVLGGTGDFENASGILTYTPRLPHLGPITVAEGYICTP